MNNEQNINENPFFFIKNNNKFVKYLEEDV
jgi:hypothetical protein